MPFRSEDIHPAGKQFIKAYPESIEGDLNETEITKAKVD